MQLRRLVPGVLAGPTLLALLCAPLFAGGAEDWPSFRGDPGQRGVAGGSLPGSLELAWTFDAGGAIASSPVVADGRVFFGCDTGKVHALRTADGEPLWEFATQDIVEAPALVHAGTVYVGSSDGYLYALDAASGELRWRGTSEDKILGGASWVADPSGDGAGRVVVGSYDNRLYCFDAGDGRTLWTYETENYINGTPALDGERVVFGGCDAVLHVVSAVSGQALGTVPLRDDCHIAGSVAVADGRAYFGHYGNAFVCIELSSGEEPGRIVWQYADAREGFFSAPAVGPDRVVFGGRDKQVHCVRRDTGEGLWTFRTRRKVDSSPVICGDKVLCASGDGRLYLLALEDGSELWSYEIGESIFSSPALAGGRVFIGANDGRMYAFQAAAEDPDGERAR